ncbi:MULTISPECIES: prokaryotic E2 ligase family D protein [Pedobacter]|uniref:prokaryotic E2 ligase family D protein n=1 Tax=Pedobacter TaxID=84567 RepID=UPI001E4413E7|nr:MULTISPECIES: prokaryotic E2 ligase family D protein [Pedobacter]
MKNITDLFLQSYTPFKALLFYQNEKDDLYVESYNMDSLGKPINAHPLTQRESKALSESMQSKQENSSGFLCTAGLLSDRVLYVDRSGEGYAIWYTPEMRRHLLFKSDLGISNGEAYLPPLLWKASKNGLSLWALVDNDRPNLESKLYQAPFFNLYANGRVCMGNVHIKFSLNIDLDEFILQWEKFYFGSAFSHLLQSMSPVKGNIVLLWQQQIGTENPFPQRQLKRFPNLLKDIIR